MLNDGTMDAHDVLKALAERIRIQTINDFLDLNPTLHDLVLDMKRRVVHLLAAEDIGRLGFVVEETDDPEQWLDAMLDKLEDNSDAQRIYAALKALRVFDLRMENFLIYKVRSCLNPIDWSMRAKVPVIKELEDNPLAPDDRRLAGETRDGSGDIVMEGGIPKQADYIFTDEAGNAPRPQFCEQPLYYILAYTLAMVKKSRDKKRGPFAGVLNLFQEAILHWPSAKDYLSEYDAIHQKIDENLKTTAGYGVVSGCDWMEL